MIRRHGAELRALLMMVDAAVALAVLVVLSSTRFGPAWAATWERMFPNPVAPALLYAAGWVLALYLVGAYRLHAKWSVQSEASTILRASFWMGLCTISLLFFTDATDVSRLFLIVLFPVLAGVTVANRAAIRFALRRLRERGGNSRNVLVLGTGTRALAFAHQIEEQSALGLRVIGLIGDDPSGLLDGWPYLGKLKNLGEVMHSHVVDEVAICLSTGDWALVETIIAHCEKEGKVVRIPLEIPPIGLQRRFVEDLDGTPVLSLMTGPDHALALGAKRLFDVLAAAMGLAILLPIFATVAVYIRLRDGSPVFYRQTRIGVNGRPFTMIKFRTMVRDADARRHELAGMNEVKGSAFKLTNDPRITTWGRVLRRISFDELPQLVNVLRGEMSLVGPRPPLPAEVAGYDLWHRRKLSMKPGITGLQQVEARRDPEFDHWVALDLNYIDHWSFMLDLKIALRTVPAMLRAQGR